MDLIASDEVLDAFTSTPHRVQAGQQSTNDDTFISPSPPMLNGRRYWQKTIFDRVMGGLLLVVTSPVLLIVAALIRIESPGPILFRQNRIGLNNQTFIIYKFRTMFHHQDPESLDGSRQAQRLDPRITRCGRWLRKLSIDELPQLINVMVGNMSLVGPRPHPVNMRVNGQSISEVVPEYTRRHRVLPGITGWAQVSGWRGETVTEAQIRKRVEHDLFYITNWTLGFDVRILVLTILREIISNSAF